MDMFNINKPCYPPVQPSPGRPEPEKFFPAQSIGSGRTPNSSNVTTVIIRR